MHHSFPMRRRGIEASAEVVVIKAMLASPNTRGGGESKAGNRQTSFTDLSLVYRANRERFV
jgi:hypothetical protein